MAWFLQYFSIQVSVFNEINLIVLFLVLEITPWVDATCGATMFKATLDTLDENVRMFHNESNWMDKSEYLRNGEF